MTGKGLSCLRIMVMVIAFSAVVTVFAADEAAEIIEAEGTAAIVQNDTALAREIGTAHV